VGEKHLPAAHLAGLPDLHLAAGAAEQQRTVVEDAQTGAPALRRAAAGQRRCADQTCFSPLQRGMRIAVSRIACVSLAVCASSARCCWLSPR
jgi:hypothetical protein